DLPVESLQMQIGPALFSHIFGSWQQLSAGTAPAATAGFPAFPAASSALDLTSIVTVDPGAGTTVSTVQPMCLAGAAAKQVQQAVASYDNAATNQMLIPPVWNLPADYRTGQYFKGGLDRTCAAAVDPAADADVAKWCDWMRWNLPGPLSVNPYPKVPSVAGVPVPLLIAQGMDDNVIHCIAPGGSSDDTVPGPADCMSRALFDSLSAAAYCPPGATSAHLELDTFRKIDLESPSTHFSVPGQISAKGGSRSSTDLVFDGSPLQQFMAARSIVPPLPAARRGCSTPPVDRWPSATEISTKAALVGYPVGACRSCDGDNRCPGRGRAPAVHGSHCRRPAGGRMGEWRTQTRPRPAPAVTGDRTRGRRPAGSPSLASWRNTPSIPLRSPAPGN
ncbi:MAG TPA: hypothetical protein VII33_21310, partial [Nakamurella sp.]